MIDSTMLWRSGPVFLLLLALSGQPAGHSVQELFPDGAKVIETADVTAIAKKPRAMVLWMARPVTRSGGTEYCGSSVHGDYFEGPTRLSLIDPSNRLVINTINIQGRSADGAGTVDSFQIPFLVSGAYYYVPHLNPLGKGKPEILHLQNLTGNDIPAEFALFIYDACGIVSTGVLGYEPRFDRVVQYPVEVHDATGSHVEKWVEQVFATKPVRPGHWRFNWKIGHGSDDVFDEDVSFDPIKRVFIQRQTTSRSGHR